MNKSELIDEIARRSNMSNAEAGRALNAAIDSITDTLKNDQSVNIAGFGSFCVRDRKARQGVNPATGEKIQIQARKQPAFKPGASLKKAVN